MAWIRQDIGGDTQRIDHANHKNYLTKTFKHILGQYLLASYFFNGKNYNFLFNGQTGLVLVAFEPILFLENSSFLVLLSLCLFITVIAIFWLKEGRTLVIGDIHQGLKALQQVLHKSKTYNEDHRYFFRRIIV